jgi:hypothetical protein
VPPSARPHDCAGRRDITRPRAVGALQARLPATSAGAFPSVPAAFPGGARRCPRGGPAGVLWRDPCRLGAATIRRNCSFPAPCPFHSAMGKHLHDITDQSSIKPSATLARPGPQSSAALSPHHSAQNRLLPTPLRNQFPIDGQLRAALPRVRSSEAFGRRLSALARLDCSCHAGIRNPNRFRPFVSLRANEPNRSL